MSQIDNLKYYKCKILNLNVLDKLMRKAIYFQGKVEHLISLYKRINRVFIIERNYRFFMEGKANWVADYYQGNDTELFLATRSNYKKLVNGIYRSYNGFKHKNIYKVNNILYIAYNLKELKKILNKE